MKIKNSLEVRLSGLKHVKTAASALVIAMAAPGIAMAQAPAQETMRILIERQPLETALMALADQKQTTIFAQSDLVAKKMAPSLEGEMSTEVALDRMLRGTDLIYKKNADGSYIIRRTKPDDGKAPAKTSVQPVSSQPLLQEREITEEASVQNAIIVTAQRREQSIMDVPFAVTALNSEKIEDLGILSLRDVSLYTPGLLVEDQSPNNPIFVMRGITSSGGDSFTEPRVSVFQDGVPISKSRGSNVELFDISRVEIAKGPQSTMFGRGALIGGVNIIQNEAADSFDWSAGAAVGNFDHRQFDGMVNIPVSDEFALRVSGRHREQEGTLKNLAPDAEGDLNGLDMDAARVAMRFKPNERLETNLFVNYQAEMTDGTEFKSMYMNPTDPATGEVLAGTAVDDGVWLSAPDDIRDGDSLGVDQDYAGITALVDFQLTDSLTLSSITGYRDVSSVEVYDADGISLELFTNKEDLGSEQANQELRLAYDNGGKVSWFVGANYYHEVARSKVDVRFDERMLLAQVAGMLNGGPLLGLPAETPAPAFLFDNVQFTGSLAQGLLASLSGGNILLDASQTAALAGQLNRGHIETSHNRSDTTAYDVFGDITFRPFERLEVSAGARYTSDDKETSWASEVQSRSILGGMVGAAGLAATGDPVGVATGQGLINGLIAFGTDLSAPLPAFGINAQPTSNNGDFYSDTLSDDGFTWRLAGKYDLTEAINLYSSYARGRRPAVLSVSAPSAPGGTPNFAVAPAETADTFEVGLKRMTSDLNFDASLYYYDYSNFQTRELIGSAFVTTNAGEASAYGMELQADWSVTENIDLFGTYAYNNARFDNGAYEGNRFARSPDHMLSIGGSFRHQALGGEFNFVPSLSWRSKIFFADDNDRSELQTGRLLPDLIQDEYQGDFGLLNASLGYSPDKANWEVEVYVRNALDETYRRGAGSAGESIGLPTNVLGEPRMYGLRLTIGG